jgi:hypothetical protein
LVDEEKNKTSSKAAADASSGQPWEKTLTSLL